jgi:hypothetical protein
MRVVTLVLDLELEVGEVGLLDVVELVDRGVEETEESSFCFRAEGPGEVCGELSAILVSPLDLILILAGEAGDVV